MKVLSHTMNAMLKRNAMLNNKASPALGGSNLSLDSLPHSDKHLNGAITWLLE